MRFTQPGALNDPFELRPQLHSLIAEAEILTELTAEPVDLGPMVEQAYSMLPESIRNFVPLDEAAKAVGAVFATDETRAAAAGGLRRLLQSMPDGAAVAREQIYQALSTVGILSLSEVPDHELMWSHYAASHTGFVLGFDERHPFFHRRRTEHDEFFFLRKVVYADVTPVPSVTNMRADAVMVTKGSQWAYEKEWRMILPLAEASRLLEAGAERVHLFAFPGAALECVVLGANLPVGLEAKLRGLLRARSDLSHVHVCRAALDLNARTVSVARIPPGGV